LSPSVEAMKISAWCAPIICVASERAAPIVVADDGAHSLIDLLSRNIDLRIVFRSSSSTVIDCKSRMISSARSVTP
jgi:hypothetical protein